MCRHGAVLIMATLIKDALEKATDHYLDLVVDDTAGGQLAIHIRLQNDITALITNEDGSDIPHHPESAQPVVIGWYHGLDGEGMEQIRTLVFPNMRYLLAFAEAAPELFTDGYHRALGKRRHEGVIRVEAFDRPSYSSHSHWAVSVHNNRDEDDCLYSNRNRSTLPHAMREALSLISELEQGWEQAGYPGYGER